VSSNLQLARNKMSRALMNSMTFSRKARRLSRSGGAEVETEVEKWAEQSPNIQSPPGNNKPLVKVSIHSPCSMYHDPSNTGAPFQRRINSPRVRPQMLTLKSSGSSIGVMMNIVLTVRQRKRGLNCNFKHCPENLW
jgi:hypothetical protein